MSTGDFRLEKKHAWVKLQQSLDYCLLGLDAFKLNLQPILDACLILHASWQNLIFLIAKLKTTFVF